jgi:hypothetical protein
VFDPAPVRQPPPSQSEMNNRTAVSLMVFVHL